MRKFFVLLAVAFFATESNATAVIIQPTLNAKKIFILVGNTGNKISLMELSTIQADGLQRLTGRKMSFFERMSFHAAQRKLRKNINADGSLSKRFEKLLLKRGGETGFHIGGFALGFFLGVIGVLLAYLAFNDDYKRNRIKWAWIGFGVIFILDIIYIIAVINSLNTL